MDRPTYRTWLMYIYNTLVWSDDVNITGYASPVLDLVLTPTPPHPPIKITISSQ